MVKREITKQNLKNAFNPMKLQRTKIGQSSAEQGIEKTKHIH